MKNTFRLVLLSLLFLFCKSNAASAQGFSYVYIQGDKKTPVYTKVEGVMMPRYGKNYALLSRLAPGPLMVEILFQQNEFPPLTFTILVPENGKRAFVLNHKGDEFSLYDVEQNFYLKPGNTENDDHLPTVLNNNTIKPGVTPIADRPVAATEPLREEIPIVKNEVPLLKEEPKVIMPEQQVVVETSNIAPANNPETPMIEDSSKPKFIPDITFNNDANSAVNTTSNKSETVANTNDQPVAVIPNSDCGTAISQTNFQRLLDAVSATGKEGERITLIQNAAKQNCMTTNQAAALIEKLDTDLGKLSVIKTIYPKITDQVEFRSLESLLQEEDSKSYFKMLTGQ